MRRVHLPPDSTQDSHAATPPSRVSAIRVTRVLTLLVKRSIADEIFMTAAALSYKTLLGLIPILVVVTLVAKTLMGEQFAPFVAGFIKSLGLDQMQITPPPGATTAPAGPVALGSWVEDLVTKASQIDLSALGSVGVLVTVASAIWLMSGIEESFNRIYRARQGRAWLRRVVLYWFVLTASPLLIGAIPLLAGLIDKAGENSALAGLLSVVKAVWDLAVLWILLLVVYVVVPSARVRLKSAAVGSLVAAVCILALKWFLTAYFARAFGISRLYGSLGLIPVFMFWMYFVWLMVLIGLEVTSIAQSIRARGMDAGDSVVDGRFSDPTLLLAIMEKTCDSWGRGEAPTRDSIAAALSIDDRLAAELLEELVRAGFLRHTTHDAYIPARPPETIRADEVLRAGMQMCAGDCSIARADVANELRRIQLEAAAKLPVVNGSR
jgi:YihY family inner membrane protein